MLFEYLVFVEDWKLHEPDLSHGEETGDLDELPERGRGNWEGR